MFTIITFLFNVTLKFVLSENNLHSRMNDILQKLYILTFIHGFFFI